MEVTHVEKVEKSFVEVKFDTRIMTRNSSDREKGKDNLGGRNRKGNVITHTHTHTGLGIFREHGKIYCD